jgi:hypothetical protein
LQPETGKVGLLAGRLDPPQATTQAEWASALGPQPQPQPIDRAAGSAQVHATSIPLQHGIRDLGRCQGPPLVAEHAPSVGSPKYSRVVGIRPDIWDQLVRIDVLTRCDNAADAIEEPRKLSDIVQPQQPMAEGQLDVPVPVEILGRW